MEIIAGTNSDQWKQERILEIVTQKRTNVKYFVFQLKKRAHCLKQSL